MIIFMESIMLIFMKIFFKMISVMLYFQKELGCLEELVFVGE